MTVRLDDKGEADLIDEEVLIEWILENEPQILVEVAKFWVYDVFSLT